MIADLLLTQDEVTKRYSELHEQNYEYPYFFKIKKGNQCLYYIGFQHSYDLENPQFPKLKKYWSEFLKETEGEERIVLQEGGKRSVLDSEVEAIKEGGEAHLMAYLAHNEGILWESPEPDEKEEIEYLLKKFSKDQIMYYYIARVVNQYHRLTKKPNLRNYIEGKYLKMYEELTGWEDFDFSFEYFIKLHDQTHDHHFDPDNEECFYYDSAPFGSEVCSECSEYRDRHIVTEVEKYWNEGKSIFIVYGSGHAIKQEEAIKSLV